MLSMKIFIYGIAEMKETIKVEEKQFGELLDVKIKEKAVL